MAPALHSAEAMIDTIAPHAQTSALRTGVGFAQHSDTLRAIIQAAEIARARLGRATPHVALVVTAGSPPSDPVPALRETLGSVGIAGGAAAGLLTEHGTMQEGALVVCLSIEGDSASGVVCTRGRDAAEAGSSAARIIMSGWPFRLRYPRGLGFAFAGPPSASPVAFLESWRQFMGPKMRTVCGVLGSSVLYGSSAAGSTASVACVEAPYATGLGYAEAFGAGGQPDPPALIHGAAEATTTALKRLDDHSARLVVVLESAARHQVLGAFAADEWARVQAEVADRAPVVGWLCERVAGYGRGIQPVDVIGSLVVAAVGDPPSAQRTE